MLVYRLSNFYKTHFRIILFCVLAGALLLAWSHRFIQDDAFISLRYADNFVRGRGLVWNDGERVEGYTNCLWTLLMSVPLRFNLDPIRFSFACGLALFALSLFFTYRLAAHLLRSKHLALLTITLLGLNYSFSSYATGGMETQLQTCLFVACTYLLLDCLKRKAWTPLRVLLLSVLLSLSLLTRLDSMLLLIVLLPIALFLIFREETTQARKAMKAVYLFAPLLLLVGTWLVWKLRFYGAVLPNTFYVKVNSLTSFKRGLIYVYLFFNSYWLIPFPILFIIFFKRLWRKESAPILILSLVTLLWLLYVIAVGGDFMEFRFLVPVLPFIFIQIMWLIFNQIKQIKIRACLIILILLGSLHHALMFQTSTALFYDVESTQALQFHITGEKSDWAEIGKVLGDAFNYDSENVTIAVTPAGAIPYYSRLKSVDMLGLNDAWVARHGEIALSKPGHQRRATLEYLLERRVNLLIGHPQMIANESKISQIPWNDYFFYTRISRQDNLPVGSKLIEIPINSKYKLLILYLVQNSLVDEAIQKKGWITHSIPVQND